MADNEVNPPPEQTHPEETQPQEVAEAVTDTLPQPPVEPIRAPDVEEEEEEEENNHQVVAHTGPRQQSVRYDLIAVQYFQRFSLQTLLFLSMVWSLLSHAASVTQTVGVGVARSLQTQLYVFFQGSTYPYRVQDYTIAGPGIAPVEWYYNADSKVFISANLYNTSNEIQSHHFEWLSGEIQFNGLSLYDVTEFLQQVRWAGASRPSSALVLAAWSLHSGIVLNLRDGLVLKVIQGDGSESTLTVRV